MTAGELDNLVRVGQLRREPFEAAEFNGLLRSGRARLADARARTLSLESRFDLAYNAAHAFALAALRRAGYRAENRQVVFQVLGITLGVPASVWRVLARCHALRNVAEYEGVLDVEDRLVLSLIEAASSLEAAVLKLSNR
jgi:hypothetical protein